MAKVKKPADAAKDKAAKQKKIAIGLVCLLALAMAYAVHTMMAMSGGASASKPQAVDPSAPTTTPVATPDTPAPAAPSLAGSPVATDPAAPVTDGSTATDGSQLLAAVSPPADAGQLESFSRFESKDPFANGAGSAPASGGSSGTGSTGSGGSGGSSGSTPSPPAVPPAPPNPPPTSAVIAVNGLSETVNTSATFPTTSPTASTNGLFELVSLTAKTATIAVVGGSYASGSQTLKLTVNKSVTLVNTADGTRYTLTLYPQGTAVSATPAAGASGGSVTPPVATSPTTTPTTTTTTPTTGG